MPSSCKDLNILGYTLPGIYLVQGQTSLANNATHYKIEFIFCNFISPFSRGRIPVKDLPGRSSFKNYIRMQK